MLRFFSSLRATGSVAGARAREGERFLDLQNRGPGRAVWPAARRVSRPRLAEPCHKETWSLCRHVCSRSRACFGKEVRDEDAERARARARVGPARRPRDRVRERERQGERDDRGTTHDLLQANGVPLAALATAIRFTLHFLAPPRRATPIPPRPGPAGSSRLVPLQPWRPWRLDLG